MAKKVVKRLVILCPGTEQRWDLDFAALLGVSVDKRTNLRELVNALDSKSKLDDSFEDIYFFLDGPGIYPDEHNPVPLTAKFSKTKDDFITGEFQESKISHLYDKAYGASMDTNAQVGMDLIKYLEEIGQLPEEIVLVGYSRGGSETFKIANLAYNHAPTAKIRVKIFAIDPVHGPGHANEEDIINVSPNVESCIVFLATDESLPGFEPQDRLKFQSNATKRVFLPFSNDHLTIIFWVVDLLKKWFLGENHPIYKGNVDLIKDEKIDKRRRPLETDENGNLKIDKDGKFIPNKHFDEPRTRRVRQVQNNPDLYKRTLDPKDPKQSVETYYEKGNTGKKVSDPDNKIETSLLINTGILFEKLTSKIFRFFGSKRKVAKESKHYTNHPFFDNLHHEFVFSQAYPTFYNWIMGEFSLFSIKNNTKQCNEENRDLILKEFKKIITYSNSAKYFETHLLEGGKINELLLNENKTKKQIEDELENIENKLQTLRQPTLNYATNASSPQQIAEMLQSKSYDPTKNNLSNNRHQDVTQLLEFGIYKISQMEQRQHKDHIYHAALELRKLVKELNILIKKFPNDDFYIIREINKLLMTYLEKYGFREIAPLIQKAIKINDDNFQIINNYKENEKLTRLNMHQKRITQLESIIKNKFENSKEFRNITTAITFHLTKLDTGLETYKKMNFFKLLNSLKTSEMELLKMIPSTANLDVNERKQIRNFGTHYSEKDAYLENHLKRIERLEKFIKAKVKFDNLYEKRDELISRKINYKDSKFKNKPISDQDEKLKQFDDKIEILHNKIMKMKNYINDLEKYRINFENENLSKYQKMTFTDTLNELEKSEMMWLQGAKNIIRLSDQDRVTANNNLGTGLGSATTPKIIDKIYEDLSDDSFNNYVRTSPIPSP